MYPTKYFPEASSINFYRSAKYGLGVLRNALEFRLHRWKLIKSPLFAQQKTAQRELWIKKMGCDATLQRT